MVAPRPAMILVAGLVLAATALATSFSNDARSDSGPDPATSLSAATGSPRQIAQASSTDAASEDEEYRSMTVNAVNAVRNFGKPKKTDEALSSMVVAAIQNLDRASNADSAGGEAAADELRAAIRELVKHAEETGKSNDYVIKLIEEAVATSKTAVPLALLGSDGSLDTAVLIQSVVNRSLEPAESDADAAYLAALKGEAATTTTAAAAPAAKQGKVEPARQTAAREQLPSKFLIQARPESIVVAPGDTLGDIAWKYYGDTLAYLKIFDANRDRLRHPDLIYVGAKLRLP